MVDPNLAGRRGSKLAPLPPLQVPPDPHVTAPTIPGARRMSASWTDNLDDVHEVKSPLAKMAAFLHPSTEKQISPLVIETHGPPERKISSEALKSPDSRDKPEKKQRRESLKGHLLKFKMKAGKVLEEVHDRLVDDHSAAVGPQPQISPSQHISNELMSEDFEDTSASDERVKSPTLSQSSKRTSNSAEMKASLRSKIRKQAEKVVERTRGSVQLTRRLQRRLTFHAEEGPSESDLRTVDEQIETSLKMGERFISTQPPSDYPPEDVQTAFFTDTYTDEDPKVTTTGPPLRYSKAKPAADEDPLLLVNYQQSINDLESGRPSGWSKMGDRLPRSLRLTSGQPRSIPEDIIAKTMKSPPLEVEAHTYAAATKWNSYQQSRNYQQLDVHLDCICITSHKWMTTEDSAANKLYAAYTEQMRRIEYALYLSGELQNTRGISLSSGEMTRLSTEAQAIHNDIVEGAKTLRKLWGDLNRQRDQQGYSVTSVVYKRWKKSADESSQGQTLEAQSVQPYLGLLYSNGEVTPTPNLPANVRELKEKRASAMFSVALYFNNMKVAKTPPRSLQDMYLAWSETYNLEIQSHPKSMHFIIFEKIGSAAEKPIVKVPLSIPAASQTTRLGLKSVDLQFTKTIKDDEQLPEQERVSGTLTCSASWTKARGTTSESRVKFESPYKKSDSFSLVPVGCRLVSDEEFESNLRWEVLEKRFLRRLPKNVDSKRVGIDSSEIDPSLLFSEERALFSKGYRTGIDGHRAAGSTYAAMIRSKLLARHLEEQSAMSYEEVVREHPMPTGFGAFGGLFGPVDDSRKLKPMRRPVTRAQTTRPADCNIVVNLQSAINLPVRKNGTLQPLVEISFQGRAEISSVVSGRHPNWQQSLHLRIDPDIGDLKTVIDHLHIKIYDQLVSPLERDDREHNTVHEQLLRRLIGTIRIPFSTIYCRGKIDGGLRVQTPLFLTGYSLSDRACYLKLLIALDPPITPPKVSPPLKRESAEPEKVLSQCATWVKSCRGEFEDRRFIALVSDINGRTVLPCRYLRPLHAPHWLVPQYLSAAPASRRWADAACQAVAALPFLADPMLFPGTTDLWTTAEQFISIGCGDEEEHAVLVCCWLLAQHAQSYIVLGSALPEGEKAAFVLTKLSEGMTLLNPSDGNIYSIDDSLCPLMSVGTVIAQNNIYANIQQNSHPSHINYDFTKVSDWKPVFDKDMDNLESVQPSVLSYQEVAEDSLMELRSSIEREIKLRFDEARQFAIPQWNLMASRILRELLQEGESLTTDLADERLARLKESYNITATGIRMPYTTLQACVSSVLSLDLHLTTDPSAQFALAIHIQPYFNNIISCHIALATMTLKK